MLGEGDDPCPAGMLSVLVTAMAVANGLGMSFLRTTISMRCPVRLKEAATPWDSSGSPNGYLGGGHGVILTTNDLGAERSNQTVPALTGGLDSVACPSATTCFAVGQGTGDVGGLILTMTPGRN